MLANSKCDNTISNAKSNLISLAVLYIVTDAAGTLFEQIIKHSLLEMSF